MPAVAYFCKIEKISYLCASSHLLLILVLIVPMLVLAQGTPDDNRIYDTVRQQAG
jgi:hypothetical protein